MTSSLTSPIFEPNCYLCSSHKDGVHPWRPKAGIDRAGYVTRVSLLDDGTWKALCVYIDWWWVLVTEIETQVACSHESFSPGAKDSQELGTGVQARKVRVIALLVFVAVVYN